MIRKTTTTTATTMLFPCILPCLVLRPVGSHSFCLCGRPLEPATLLADLVVTPSVCRYVQYRHFAGVLIVTYLPTSVVQVSPTPNCFVTFRVVYPDLVWVNSRTMNRYHSFHVFGPGQGCIGYSIVDRDILVPHQILQL
jgi:hypothetical protein